MATISVAMEVMRLNNAVRLLSSTPFMFFYLSIRFLGRGALQRGPGRPWPTQNFRWVGYNAFGPHPKLACMFVNSLENQ